MTSTAARPSSTGAFVDRVRGVRVASWATAGLLALAVVLQPPTAAFARLKARRRDIAWLRYL